MFRASNTCRPQAALHSLPLASARFRGTSRLLRKDLNMATFTLLSPEDGARIAAAHELGSCLGVVAVPAGTVNSNYFLDTTRGRVFVRLYEQQEVDGVSYEWTLLDHLSAR